MELFESASFGIMAFFVFNYTLDLETNFNAFRNNSSPAALNLTFPSTLSSQTKLVFQFRN